MAVIGVIVGVTTRVAIAQAAPSLLWDEDPSSMVSGFAVSVDNVRTDYGLTPVQADGSCKCRVTLPFSNGRHTLVVSAYNDYGEAASAPFVVGPTADAGGPYSAQASTTLIVDASRSTDQFFTMTGYSWSWGDGTSDTSTTPPTASHTYGAAGTFTITLTVVDDFPASHSITTTATIAAPPVPPPSAPTSPRPNQNEGNVPTTSTLGWTAAGASSYDIVFGTTNPPPIVASGITVAAYAPAALAAGTTYYWQIVAFNSSGSAAGPVWSFTTASAQQSGDLVVYASDLPAAALHGSWSRVDDPSSPNGVKLITGDLGWTATFGPLATPANYVDVMFDAAAGTAYTLWLRLQALSNSKYNDSIWAQFSDALIDGAPVYQLDTPSALLANLASDGTGASLDRWGWQNHAYWLSQPTTVTFASSGSHTLRIQVREDGVELDQIVLSPATYLRDSPGLVTNDSTIVPKAGPPPGLPPSPPPAPPPPAPADIVVYASDLAASALHGSWTAAADATSPNGTKLVTPDLGWAVSGSPLAGPIDYVDVTFDAPADTPYTIWFRLQATNDNKYNDAVWAQFSDALVNGSPVYRLNSSAGLLVNLATDSGAGSLRRWGWQNTAYWVAQPTTMTFATTGTHTMRIQVREDGVQLDQIVLSPSKYLNAAPGTATDDATWVAR